MLTARLDRMALGPGASLLDLGCGAGRHVHGVHMLDGVHVVGVDLDADALGQARSGLDVLPRRADAADALTGFAMADATRLPFGDDRFDAVICSEVLEHVRDPRDVIGEIRRVLKPGGRLCISVPHGWPERLCWRLAPPPDGYPFQPGGHVRIFDEVALRYTVEAAGFQRILRHHAHGLHAPYWWLKCLFWGRATDHPLARAWHAMLVWDILKRPWPTRLLDRLLSPVMGKSLVLYFGPPEARR